MSSIPLEEEIPVVFTEAADVEPGGKGLSSERPSLLIVDDDPFTLAVHARMLRTMGYGQVATASSGEAALAIIGEPGRHIDVVLCDINMPSMDGIEFLKILNGGAFNGSVILLSGEGLRILHAVRRLLTDGRLGILGILEKPVRRRPLQALLENWRPLHAGEAGQFTARFSDDALFVAVREQQLMLHYQPKVDLRSGAVVGAEALLRWIHPVEGLVYPDRFIGQAEECGVIEPLTEWVVSEALCQQTAWRNAGLSVQMAINISMENLDSPSFAARMLALARDCDAAPQRVTFEITESRMMAPTQRPLENLVRLRLQRFGLSIDDFGTGHSSLAQLRDAPFNELKIDLGFVQGARYNEIIRPILEGSIGIARRMDISTVAEGVEAEDDWQLLRSLGCDQAQGNLIGRPMPPQQFIAWLAKWPARAEALRRY